MRQQVALVVSVLLLLRNSTRREPSHEMQTFLSELLEVSKTNMEYFLQIIFSNGERGERVLGGAKKTVDFAMRDLRTVTCVL